MPVVSIRAALAALALAILLTACGGGGGGGNSQPQPVTPPTARTDKVRVGYFGVDGDQIRETADHVNLVLAMDWGDWSTQNYDQFRIGQIIAQLQEAKARGIKEAWVAVGFLVFTQHPGCTDGCYIPRPDGIARLHAFKQQLDALGLLDGLVTTLYPADEPELHGLDDATLAPLLQQIKAEWPAYIAVIYGDTHSYPGLRGYDLIGKDDYGRGAGVLDELPPIDALQRYILVPGGASPWRQDPRPFCAYAVAHADVYAIVSFLWVDSGDMRGIRGNGLAPTYKQTYQQLEQSSTCPP